MKNNFHLFWLTALMMLFGQSLSAHDFAVDGIYYNYLSQEDKTVRVTYKGNIYYSYSDEYSGNVVIPESVTYQGTTYSVTSIGENAFHNCTDLTSIQIPNSVTSISSSAFLGCTGLTSIFVDASNSVYDSRNNCNAIIETSTNTLIAGYEKSIIPNSVTSIGEAAFSGCTGLTSIEIPNSVTSIGTYAFAYCTGLTSIEIPNSVTSIGWWAFESCTGLTSIEIPNSLTSIGYCAFWGCTGLTSIEIPNSVTSIDVYAFYDCTGLTSIEIPNSVTSIGLQAFYGCTGLTSIEIPNSVTSIGGSAFAGTAWYDNQPDGLVYAGMVAYEYKGTMPNNTNLILKDGTLGIADYAFSRCTGLTSIEIPNSVTNIGGYAFSRCTGLTSIEIPNSVTSIGQSAFANCTGLTSIEIPNSVTSIGVAAFSGCTGLTSIQIPNSVTSIGQSAFHDCTGVTSIQIPNSVTSIGDWAFEDCTGLTSIQIPNSVTSIGSHAFYDCTGLTSITVLSTTPVSIGSETFSNRANATLYVPKGSKAAYEAADYWKEFKDIIEIDISNNFEITDGDELTYEDAKTYDNLIYSRTFSNTNWQSLYVPFSIPVDSLSKYGLQVAELNDTHQWDFDGDGVADSTRVEFFTLTSGSTEANYPYLIRATEPTTLSLTLKDIEVKAAEENSIECSSTKQKFTFVGTYTGVSGADMYNNNYYGMSGGGLKRVSSTSVSLKPQRWYMKIENKNGSPVNYFAPSIRFTVDGIDEEEEETSAIVDKCTESRNRHKAFYSLEGIRQHTAPTQRGMYVRQDKKLIIR